MKKFHSILTLIPFLLTVIACTSMYEVGDDRTAEFSIAPVAGVNSAFDEVAPKATTHGLLFTSNRPVDEEEERDVLYILPHGGGGQGAVRAVTMDNPSIKTGAVTLFPDGHSVLFVQCYRPDGVGDCDMLSARLTTDGAGLERIELLPEPLNDIEWDHHPALTPDGNTLIFASERFGGRGGSDLWMSTERNGEWSIPVNLGAVINTTGNEIAPCFSSDGKTLYFASDTHPGMGGFDLYVSHRVDGGWSAPNPLGMPFNSDEDDIFFAGDLAADTVYLASNRDGGEGGFDLYRAVRRVITKAPEPVREKPLVLRITAKNAYTMQTIAAEISVTHTQTEDVITEGNETVELPLELQREYTVSASHPGYMNAVENFRSGGIEEVRRAATEEADRIVLDHEITLIPITEEERKIYAFTVEFDFDLFDIRPEEERKLDSVAVLLELYPNSTVVISGHTDSVGTDMYNIRLGYNRAKQVSTYVETWLRRKNVRLQNDMEIRTYGETEPIAPNSTEEGRQRNRRVEIALVRNE